MSAETKRCTRCLAWKKLTDFNTNQATRDGRSSWCSACHRASTDRWRAEHHDELLARRREQYRAEKLNQAGKRS